MRPVQALGIAWALVGCSAAPSKPAHDTDPVDTDLSDSDPGDTDAADTDLTDTDGADTDDDLLARCLEQPTRNTTNGLDPDELCPGDLVITELLSDPQDCSANRAQGQYLEVYNASGFVVHLASSGLLLDVGAQRGHDVAPIGSVDADIAPGAYFTVHPLQFSAYCHDFAPRFALDTTTVLLSADVIVLASGSFEIDRVDFSALTPTAGRSKQLRPDAAPPSAAGNDTSDRWCDADAALLPTGSADRGTPNAVNVCAP